MPIVFSNGLKQSLQRRDDRLQSRIARHSFIALIGVTCLGMVGNTCDSFASGSNRWRSLICASP
jgi:hypothetical protein